MADAKHASKVNSSKKTAGQHASKGKTTSKSKSASKSKATSKDKTTSKGKNASKSKTSTKSAASAKTKTSASKGASNGKKSKTNVTEPQMSATMQSLARQRKLEETMPLGQFTTELPKITQFTQGPLDAPYRRPWKKVRTPKDRKRISSFDFSIFRSKGVLIGAGAVAILLLALVIIINVFTVKTTVIEGNAHYTNQEIADFVMGDRFGKNSIYLSMKYKNKDIEDIPFIQTMNVKIVNPSTIKITVYEKAMAGYVEYMGRYFYFDKDGTVVESTDVRTQGIPQILGMDFDHIVLYEKLPVDSDDIFKEILEVTQLMNKHEIEVDKIYFDKDFNITLYFADARVKLGGFDNIDEKIIRLKAILPDLADKRGVLRLDTYDGSDSIITFEKDK